MKWEQTRTWDSVARNLFLASRFRIALAILVIAVIIPAYFTEDASCPKNTVSDKLDEIKYEVFRWAPKTTQCQNFRTKTGNGDNKAADDTECSLNTDCRTFRRTLSCYNSFYSELAAGSAAKNDLDKLNFAPVANACANVQ